MAHTKKHTMRQNIAKSQLKVRQNRPPTRKKTPFSKTEYLWPDGRYRNQRPPLQSKGLASNNKVEKKVNKVEKKDPLKDYRRGPGTKLGKDTRITKKLKKSGFTEDRLARLRKKHAEFKANRKKKKNKLKVGG